MTDSLLILPETNYLLCMTGIKENGDESLKNLAELAKKIGGSYAMKCSMVDFIPALLMMYTRNEITKTQLFTEYIQKTRKAQFYYFHMPKEEIQETQRLFAKEFAFANQLTDLIMKQSVMDDEDFKAEIERIMEDYLRSVSESKTADS